jgi:hypothetical protein
MTDTIVDDTLLRLDQIDPRLRGLLRPAESQDLRRLRAATPLDVPPEYMRFFEVLGGGAEVIFGEVCTVSIANALQFYKSDCLATEALTSERFLYLGSVDVGEPFPHRMFLQAHLPDQFYYGNFEGPRPIVRADGNPEEQNEPFFADVGEFIIFFAWRLQRVRPRPQRAQVSVQGDESAIDVLLRVCASQGIQDRGLTTWCRCLEGPGQAVLVHRRDTSAPGSFTVSIGTDDLMKRTHLLEMIRDNLRATRPILDSTGVR